MGNISGVSKKLNNSLKQFTALLIVISLAIPQNLFANNSGDGNDVTKYQVDASTEFSFANVDPATLQRLGLEPGSIHTLQSSAILNNRKVDIAVIQGELPGSQSQKLLDIFIELEPEIRKAVEIDPNTKFQFIYAAPESKKTMDVTAKQILEMLRVLNPTAVKDERIPDSLVAEYQELLRNFFVSTKNILDQTTGSDVKWALARLAGAGSSTTLSFFYGMNLPIPASMMMGLIVGAGSGSIGLFLQKFTAWLMDNKVTPQNARRYNKIGSIETYMLLSPILIPLQGAGWNSVEGASIIAGGAALSVVVQNAYLFIKKRSPTAAMWYKWYATEALFLTAATYALPFFDQPIDTPWKSAATLFVTALLSTASQGVWDILLTDHLRKPKLEAAIKKDIAELAEKTSKTVITDEKYKEVVLNHKNNKKHELDVRKVFNRYFYSASLVSVLSAIAMTMGSNKDIDLLFLAGKAGLFTLGATGIATWIYVWVKRGGVGRLRERITSYKSNAKHEALERANAKTTSFAGANACVSLFR